VKIERDTFVYQGKSYVLVNSLVRMKFPTGNISTTREQADRISVGAGIGSDKAPAPQARLMATVINGILNQRLPVAAGADGGGAGDCGGDTWSALAGLRDWSYLSIATTGAMFAGA